MTPCMHAALSSCGPTYPACQHAVPAKHMSTCCSQPWTAPLGCCPKGALSPLFSEQSRRGALNIARSLFNSSPQHLATWGREATAISMRAARGLATLHPWCVAQHCPPVVCKLAANSASCHTAAGHPCQRTLARVLWNSHCPSHSAPCGSTRTKSGGHATTNVCLLRRRPCTRAPRRS